MILANPAICNWLHSANVRHNLIQDGWQKRKLRKLML